MLHREECSYNTSKMTIDNRKMKTVMIRAITVITRTIIVIRRRIIS